MLGDLHAVLDPLQVLQKLRHFRSAQRLFSESEKAEKLMPEGVTVILIFFQSLDGRIQSLLEIITQVFILEGLIKVCISVSKIPERDGHVRKFPRNQRRALICL